jgi:hypothetical protein
MEQIVAKIGSFALANFGVLAFFGWGLNIEVVKDIILQLGTFFGLLSNFEMPPYNINTVSLSFFCFYVGAVNVLSLSRGNREKPGARIAREDMNMNCYGALSVTYLVANMTGSLTGSGAVFWLVFAIVQFLTHVKIVSGNFGGIRTSMKCNLFKGGGVDSFDYINSVMFMLYGILMFLSMGLNLGFLQGFMSSMMTLFGLIEPSPPAISSGVATIFGGANALGVAALNLSAFAGSAEDRDYAEVRRCGSASFWAAAVIGMASFPESGSFFSVWTTISLVMALLLTKKQSEENGKSKGD